MDGTGPSALTPDERRLLEEAVARGLVTPEAVEALLAKRGVDEEGELQPISQLILLERAIAVPDFLALKRAIAAGEGPKAPRGPASFGPYRVVREIARGPVTALYEVDDPQGRRACVKALLALADSKAPKRKRLETEVRALQRLAHSGIARIHGASNEAGLPYLVMDLAPGLPLDRVVRERGPFEPATAAHLVGQVADAVAHAHERGVLHRDLKPANVLWSGPGSAPLLVGFGLAKVAGHDTRATMPGELVGTPAYMPPEQARPTLGPLGPAADVYGLGAILYELVTGRPPYVGQTVGEILVQLLETPLAPVRSVRGDVPESIASTIEQALAKAPGERPQRVVDFAELLARSTALASRSPNAAARRTTAARKVVALQPAPVAPGPPPDGRLSPGPTPEYRRDATPRRGSRRIARTLLLGGLVVAFELPFAGALAFYWTKAERQERRGAKLAQEGAKRLAAAASYAQAIDSARAAVASGEIDRAVALVGQAAAARPDRPDAFALRAGIRARSGQAKQALEDVDVARRLAASARDPAARDAIEREALLARARVALDTGGDALAPLEDAAKLGEPGEALALAAQARVRRFELDLADRELLRAQAENAPPVELARARALVLAARGETERALGAVALARDAAPSDPSLLATESEVLLGAGRALEAAEIARRLASLVPSHPAYALALARAEEACGNHDAAHAALERAKSLGASDATLEVRLEVARGAAKIAGPADAAARADELVDEGKLADARTIVDSELARGPSPVDRLALESVKLRALAAAHDPDALTLARALDGEGAPRRVLDVIAGAFLEARRLDDALRVCDRALAIDRADEVARRTRALARDERAVASWASGDDAEIAARELSAVAASASGPAAAELHARAAALLLMLDRLNDGLRETTAACAANSSRTDELAKLAEALRVATAPDGSPRASDSERLAVEAREIGDGEPWDALGPGDLVAPSFGRARTFGRSALLVVARGRGGATFPTRGSADGDLTHAPRAPRSHTFDLSSAKELIAFAAARGDASELSIEIALTDATGQALRLVSRRPVLGAGGAWTELRIALGGDDVWRASGQIDLARIARIDVVFVGGAGQTFAVWLDGLRGEP